MTDNKRFEGWTLIVRDMAPAVEFYSGKLGLKVEWNALPAFALVRAGAGTIGVLALEQARKEGIAGTSEKHARPSLKFVRHCRTLRAVHAREALLRFAGPADANRKH